MPLDELAAAVVLAGLIGYAIFGGADFGGGVWIALAGGPRARQQRESVYRAMGPVWETNHVWLILVIVALFTAFPSAFADLFTALLIPLVVALVGIVFRGAAFAFRHYGHETEARLPATEFVFSVASVVTPMAMGMAIGALAGGHVRIEGGEVTTGLWEPWLRPFAIWCGFIAVAMCAYLTTCYMTTRTSGELQEDFRNRGLAASLALGVLTSLAIPIAYWDAEAFWDQMVEPAPLAVFAFAVASGLFALLVLWKRWYVIVPLGAARTVALVIAGWGVVQHPYLILPAERISDMAAGDATLRAFLIALPAGALIVVPSLVLLFAVFSGRTGGPDVKDEKYSY